MLTGEVGRRHFSRRRCGRRKFSEEIRLAAAKINIGQKGARRLPEGLVPKGWESALYTEPK